MQKVKKPMRPGTKIGWQIALDLLLIGVSLCVFALFHHVLPKTITSKPIVDPSKIPQIGNLAVGNDTSSDADAPLTLEQQVDAAKRYGESPLPGHTVTKLPGYGEEGDGLRIFLRRVEYGYGNSKVTYYAADIFVESVDWFRTAVATKSNGQITTDTVDALAAENNAIFAVSGDYFKNSEIGFIVRNGTLYRNEPTPNDICMLYLDGSMEIVQGEDFSYEKAVEKGVWQAWSFGPSLLTEDGLPKRKNEDFNVNGSKKETGSPFHNQSAMFSEHPRNLIGYAEPGHYIFILIDGRDEGYSCGVDFVDESRIAYDEGCTIAYNLDGGRSAMMVCEEQIVNRPYKDGRPISDIIYFADPNK